MSYTIDTIANSSIVVDDEYERRSLANQGWELTDRPVLQAPIDGATGVSQTPTFQWAEYVKDIPITNLVYKLEVVAIASSGTAPNWTNAFVLVTKSTSANLREQLADAQFYAWRVLALSRTQPESFIDTFERASLSADYETNTIQGTGSSSIVNDELVIELDATSATARQSLRLLKNFENPNILIKGIKFSKTASNLEVILYFNEQGVIQNNQMNGYYLYFFGSDLRVGKSVNYTPSDKQSTTFARTDDTPYNVRLRTVNGHVRITIWDPATESEPSPQLDWTDNNSPYISGGITFIPVAYGDSLVETVTVDDIEVTFSEGEVTTITGVTVSGSTDDITEGNTRQFSATVGGAGNVQQSVDWSVTGGAFTEVNSNTITFTAATGSGTCSVTAESTQDNTKSDTVNFNRIEEVTTTPVTGTKAGDEAILEEIAVSWGITNLNGWASSGMDLDNPIDGVTVANIGGENRVTEINLKDYGITHSNGIPNSIENITEMEVFNIRFNRMSGPMREGIFKHQKLKYCYINHPGYYKDDPHEVASRGEGLVNNGKHKYSKPSGVTSTTLNGGWNQFSGPLPASFDMPNVEWFYITWMHEVGGLIPSGFWNSSKLKGFGMGETNMDLQQLPDDCFSQFTQLDQFIFSLEGTRGTQTPYLTGPIPSSINGANIGATLRFWKLGDQDFTALPSSMSNMTNVNHISLPANRISSPVPPEWWDGTYDQLTGIAMNANNFTGSLPASNLPNSVRRITCAYNDIEGGIPQQIWQLNGLINTDFSGNDFTGQIVVGADLTNFSQNFWKIRNMRFGDNRLSGPIPKMDWLTPSNLIDLTRTDYSKNLFTPADWNMIDDGREYVFNQDGSIDLEASDNSPIVQKTRHDWYYYHCNPNGGSGKGVYFRIGNQKV